VDRRGGEGQGPHHDQAGQPEGAGCVQEEMRELPCRR
jgi:hypothetical protein